MADFGSVLIFQNVLTLWGTVDDNLNHNFFNVWGTVIHKMYRVFEIFSWFSTSRQKLSPKQYGKQTLAHHYTGKFVSVLVLHIIVSYTGIACVIFLVF